MSLGKISTSNPVFVNIITLTLLLLGILSAYRLPREQFVEVPFYWVTVTVRYVGAPADEVEKTVTIKLEQELKGLSQLKRIRSTTGEGFAQVRVEFRDGITNDEFARLYQEVITRSGKVTLPQGVDKPVVKDFSSADFLPVIQVVLMDTGAEGKGDALYIRARALQEQLEALPGIRSVTLIGSRDRKIFIEADPERMESLGVSLLELVRSVEGSSTTLPAGTVQTPFREYFIRTGTEVLNPSSFNRLIVRSGQAAGAVVRVGDLAQVLDRFEDRGALVFYNQTRSVLLNVAKISQADSLQVVNRVKKQVERFSREAGPSFQVEFLNDSTVRIKDSIDVLFTNAIWGLILLVGILFLFVGFRNGFMIGFGIPLTFAATFIILGILGETLNTNTLFALVLVLGMLVDHGIVIVENSFRWQGLGLSKREAAIKGVDEVALPVISASATTVAAFLPLMLLPGTIGKFLRVVPLVVTLALIISTLEAILFLPSHYADWPGGNKAKPLFDLQPLKLGFKRVLNIIYRFRYVALGVATLLMVFIFSLIPRLRQDLFTGEDYPYFFIELEMPAGTNRDQTLRVVRQFEEALQSMTQTGEVKGVLSSIGSFTNVPSASPQNNLAQIVVHLKTEKEGGKRSVTSLLQEAQKLTETIPGPEKLNYRKVQSGPPVDAPLVFRFRGDRYTELAEIITLLRERMSAYPQLVNVEDSLERGTPEFRIQINEFQAARFGLTPASIGTFIRGALEGFPVDRVFIDNEEREVIVRYRNAEVTLADIQNFKIPTPLGSFIPFSAVCTLIAEEPLARITRIDGKREVSLQANILDKRALRNIQGQLTAYIRQVLMPNYPDIEFIAGGEFAEFANLLVQILQIFLLGVFLIYLILGTQFRSYGQPFLILVTIPFAFMGVILYLVLFQVPLSTTVIYAGVALAGIAVNDAIVLIDVINRLRREGKATQEAVLEAASSRLRPILLTSLTTMAGLAPTAFGIGGVSPVWGPMAGTIIFGLLFSTLSSLVVIPCLYGVVSRN
ncbi:MAG: efflux RND transporter permease subunit [Spirochaetales bacterium]